jgi:hypothetical protein
VDGRDWLNSNYVMNPGANSPVTLHSDPKMTWEYNLTFMWSMPGLNLKDTYVTKLIYDSDWLFGQSLAVSSKYQSHKVAILAGLESATPIEGIEKPLFETCGIWCG